MRIKTYFKVWKIFGANALQETLINRWSNLLFMLGKGFRFAFAMLFLLLIRETSTSFGNYSSDQVVVFFLTYQFIDLLSQSFYRGVYIFSNHVRSGEFDFILSKPISPLFRALTGKPDINDAIFMIPSLIVSLIVFNTLNISVTWSSFALYLVLLLNSMLIVTAIHIIVLVIGILTTEVDGIIWIYRDLNSMGKFPISIYMQPLRFALFFLIPIGMMITIPTEILIGTKPSYSIAIATLTGICFFITSLVLWKLALKKYSSASS